MQGDHVEGDQSIGIEVVEAQEYPLLTLCVVVLGFHPALALAQRQVEVAVLDQEDASGFQAGGEIRCCS